jgi:hypothetical protein
MPIRPDAYRYAICYYHDQLTMSFPPVLPFPLPDAHDEDDYTPHSLIEQGFSVFLGEGIARQTYAHEVHDDYAIKYSAGGSYQSRHEYSFYEMLTPEQREMVPAIYWHSEDYRVLLVERIHGCSVEEYYHHGPGCQECLLQGGCTGDQYDCMHIVCNEVADELHQRGDNKTPYPSDMHSENIMVPYGATHYTECKIVDLGYS